MLVIDGTNGVIVNDGGVDRDFRIETNNKANAFRVDGGDDQVRTDAVFVHDADGSNQPFYITRSGGLDQALKVTMDDNNVMLTSVQDETSGANFVFYSTNATTTNLNMLQLDYSAGAVFNEGGVNYQHVRMESDTDTHAFYLNAVNGYIGMGAGASPTQPLSVGVRTGANLNYINGTTNSVSTDSGILISDTITSESDVGFGLLLANNANNANARSPLIGFSALSASNGYQHLYAAINARKIGNGADTNWNHGDLEFSTSSGTGPNVRMVLDHLGGLVLNPTAAGHAVFNEDGLDADFRVESDGNSNAFVVDASANFVSVGQITYTSPGNGNNNVGWASTTDGRMWASAASDHGFNRTADGVLLSLRSGGAEEGTITISGSTCAFNGFSGRHESSGIPANTLVGTVVSTIDELDVYDSSSLKSGQTRANHAKIKVSDSVGDSCVYGVLAEFTESGKAAIASVGIGSVFVTGACSKGDLLESNGDGTAKVQADDIIRSKTIGKVTIGDSNTGVKLVASVLYCG